MKKMTFALCLSLLALWGCGDDNSTNSSEGRIIVDQTFSLPGTSFIEFRFSVDTDVQENVRLQGEFDVTGGNIQVAVMDESNFQTWRENGSPQVLYGSGLVPGSVFLVNIEESGNYFLVFSNTTDSAEKSVKAEVRLLSFTGDET